MNEPQLPAPRDGDEQPDSTVAELVAAAPGLARVAATSWWRAMRWAAETSSTATRQVIRDISRGESPTHIAATAGAGLRKAALELLGLRPEPEVHVHAAPERASSRRRRVVSVRELRARGADLLYDAADVWYEDDAHPAYARILDELSPDEARILRLLADEGAQPAIDVRTNRPLGVGSELVSGGLSMIGLQAGVRHPERTRAHLNNLYRLGLVWFSREEVADPGRYQVVEVQPEVLEVLKGAGRSPKIVRRSIHLTPFGEDFCEVCLPAAQSVGSEVPQPVEGSTVASEPLLDTDGGDAGERLDSP